MAVLAKSMNSDLFENLRLELRRGSLIIAVLAQLREEHYGYALRKALADHGMEIEESTLYPLLRRLESQRLLGGQGREEDKPNKRVYRLLTDGTDIPQQPLQESQTNNSSLKKVL